MKTGLVVVEKRKLGYEEGEQPGKGEKGMKVKGVHRSWKQFERNWNLTCLGYKGQKV